jgi:2'-5' RNA ligase
VNLHLPHARPEASPATTGRHRLFFALRPDAEAAAEIARLTAALRTRHGIAAAPIPRERLHVSLNFVGAYPEPPPPADVDRACAFASAVTMRPFVVSLNRVASWKGGAVSRPLVLTGDDGVIGIDLLRGAIHAALAGGGLAPGHVPDRWAHLTLVWGQHQIEERLRSPVRWTVREFVLLDSPFGEGRHELLGRWILAD